ncbi:MAG: hypothetical protein GXO50_00325 [Chlorobi bacterium]|nr:hypothetical protein [Chlorobiota bacterium]
MAENPQIKEKLKFAFDFYNIMQKNDVTFAYEGEITHEITKAFSSLAESHIALTNESNAVQKRVFHIMVESLQNISKHSAERKNPESVVNGQGIFMITKTDKEYNITTGNVVFNENIPALEEHIKKINSGNKQTLKNLYKEKIKFGKLSYKGGAGLGFIDMVRKTGERLIYTFFKLNDKKSYFVLTSTIFRTK